MMDPPPSFDFRTIYFQYTLANGQCTIVPDQ